jgi:hypothetical protein
MSSRGLPTLVFDVRARRLERRIALAGVVLALAVPALVTDNIGVTAALIGSSLAVSAVAAGFWYFGWIGGRAESLASLAWKSDGTWLLTDRGGRVHEAVLRTDTRVLNARFLWLRWDTPLPFSGWTRRVSLLLGMGDVPATDFRRLQVRLRLDRPGADRPEWAKAVSEKRVTPVQ